MQIDLAKIKKHYGENMMHLCKTLFPTILETDGLLFQIISSKFAYSKLLYDDIIRQDKIGDFQNYIFSFSEREKNIQESNLDPFYLMNKAGYNLYECTTEEEVRGFKKYYKPTEELCTFYANRTRDNYVFFAVKKNVDEIKRENFRLPERQDEYGTSVISIQFTKGKYNNLSIKNRYNHTVIKADATFSNNLDNIIPGLTDSFRKKYNLNIFCTDIDFEMDDYCQAKDGKYYKYNYSINDVYYGCNNVIIDIDKINIYDKEKYLVLDYFIIDLVNKKILLYDKRINDSFINLPPINKITITNNNTGKEIDILMNNNYVYLEINKDNKIVSYQSDIPNIGNDFLQHNKLLTCFIDDNLKIVGDNFLGVNNFLTTLNLPNLEFVGDYFISQNTVLDNFNFPKLRKCGSSFLKCCNKEIVTLPNLEIVGNSFLASNHMLVELYLPNLRETGTFFLNFNTRLKTLFVPKLEKVGHHFLARNKGLESVSFPSLYQIDDYFIFDNIAIKNIYLPKVERIGIYFLQHNYNLRELSIPNVLEIDDYFLDQNRLLEIINLPRVTKINNNFLNNNDHLKELYLPMLLIGGDNFLANNNSIDKLNVPNLHICGNSFIPKVKKLSSCILNANISKGHFFLEEYLKNKELLPEKQLVKIKKY